MWNRLLALLKKEFIQMWRDKMLLFILIWSFTVSPFIASNTLKLCLASMSRNFAISDGESSMTKTVVIGISFIFESIHKDMLLYY